MTDDRFTAFLRSAADLDPAADLRDDVAFADLGLDSLGIVSVYLAARREYGVVITADDVASGAVDTVGGLRRHLAEAAA